MKRHMQKSKVNIAEVELFLNNREWSRCHLHDVSVTVVLIFSTRIDRPKKFWISFNNLYIDFQWTAFPSRREAIKRVSSEQPK